MRDKYYEAALKFAQEHGYDGDELPTGILARPGLCPLANAFPQGTMVSRTTLYFWDGSEYAEFPLPRKVSSFVKAFDYGEYPELLEKPL